MPPPTNRRLAWTEESINNLAKQSAELVNVSRSFMRVYQDDVTVNATMRMEFQKDITYLKEAIKELQELLLKGNGQPSIAHQITTLTHNTTQHKKDVELLYKTISDFSESLKKSEARINNLFEDLKISRMSFESSIDKIKILIDNQAEILRGLKEVREKEDDILVQKKSKIEDRWWSMVIEIMPSALAWLAFGVYLIYKKIVK